MKVKETIIKIVGERGDDYGQAIINSLLPVSDFVTSDCHCHYHKHEKNVQSPRNTKEEKKWSFANDVQAAMEDVFTYFEPSD